MSKALLIQSYTELINGVQGSWNQLNMATSYIQGIQTGDILGTVNAATLSALISGVPSPWARAKLFKYALDTLSNPNPNINNDGGLTNFYQILHGEWRGLLAVIALYPDRIRFSNPVVMDTRGADYCISATFGRMLFDDKDVWSNQEELVRNPDAQPFVQLIYYKEQLVGGTSPLTGVFTGVNYSRLGETASDIPWYREGKFEAPDRYLTPQQLQKVYLFVRNLNSNAESFEKLINSMRNGKRLISLEGFKTMARRWERELSGRGNGKLQIVGPVAQYSSLKQPFKTLFKSDVPVYLRADYTFTYTDDGNCLRIGDIQELLSNDNYVIGWCEPKNQRPKLADAPVYYLRVDDIATGDAYYFTIPLSETGIDIFRNKLDTLLGYIGGSNTRLVGHITDAGLLAAELTVEIDGESVTLNDREYHIQWITSQGSVIAWPNFVSEKWKKYYLYSEYVDGDSEQFIPFFRWQGNIIKTIDGQFLTSRYEPGPTESREVNIKRLVNFPAELGESLLRYNIITADKPICGLRALVKETGTNVGAGFLMLRGDVVKDLTQTVMTREAVVGVDFGSNNTCIFYNADNLGARPVEFANFRAVLVGRENIDPRAMAQNNEVLFFTNYPSDNGQMKSWLHEHDARYIGPHKSEEVAGGVPVNRPNICVRKMDEYEITTQAGKLHYNMKWLDSDTGLEKKRAFLKSLWLQACAFLYTNRIRITGIEWSFPGSMMASDRDELERIYEDLCRITPYGSEPELPRDHITEAEAVCSYALSRNFGLTANNLFLGLDVGGSTSDILLIARDTSTGTPRNALLRESSVRLAAGVFFNAVISSDEFRQALVDFQNSRRTNVYVENIHSILTTEGRSQAPYYLNSIFDQLKTSEDYEAFYETMAQNAKFVFTIPAYVCGLLLFYSGMLIGKAIKDNNLNELTDVELMPFGKGGRIFHWLRHATSRRTAREFYENCVNAGLQIMVPERTVKVNYRDEIEEDNKTEVARGLCEQRDISIISRTNDSDICGEEGVCYHHDGRRTTINSGDEISGEHFDEGMSRLTFDRTENFNKYMELFIDFVGQRTNLYRRADELLQDELHDLPTRIVPYCTTTDREYQKAVRNRQRNGFHYHQPIIIAEGACFLKTLINKVFNR
jgi:hypothetical protein